MSHSCYNYSLPQQFGLLKTIDIFVNGPPVNTKLPGDLAAIDF